MDETTVSRNMTFGTLMLVVVDDKDDPKMIDV